MQQNRVRFFLLSKGVFLFLFPPFFGRHYKTLDINKKGKSFPLFAQRYLTLPTYAYRGLFQEA